MSFSNDYPFVVAPRPVRLTAYNVIVNRAHTTHERVRISDSSPLDDFKVALFNDSSDKDPASPRSSPRSGLPSEAVEEFLSILRPSFFPPASPVLRTRRQAAASLPTYSQDRSFSLQGRARLELMSQSSDTSDDMDITRSQQPSRNAICHTPDSMNDAESSLDLDNDSLPFRWYKNNILSSPISRTHTRNPFLRHASNKSPVLISPLSPAAIPLPQPTPDEMVEMS